MLNHDSITQRLAIALAVLAGFIDALGYLSLGGVFVSFMSGNSTRFAVDAGHADFRAALIPLAIIFLFVCGVMTGRAIRHFSARRPSTSIMIFMSCALTAAGLFQLSGATIPAVSLLAVAMGAVNNVFFRDGEVSVGVTYMTGTLVRFGQRLAGKMLGEKEHNWLPYLLLWTGLAAGAILGAFGYNAYGLHILWAGVVACYLLTAVFFRIEVNDAKPL